MSAEQIGAIKKGKYRPEIDGLRAFAVVAVIINHFNKDILPGGYLGVDIFFVISGYVITSSLLGRPSKDFKDFISGFYERRVKRLVPALSVFVLITSITICLFNPSPGGSLQTGLTSLFGLSNLYLLRQSTDYFAESTELNVFTHTWSLGVEEQFYIAFPFLIWFSGFGRQTKNGARNLFLVVCALTIASLIAFLYLYPTNQPAAYFLMPSRFWEMAAGCLIFIGFQKRASIEQFLEKVPPLLVLTLIVGVMYLPMSFAASATIAVVVMSSILIASLKKETAAFQIFTNAKVVYIGLISYSLYLWHWGVLSISRWTIGIHWWSVPLQVALMFGLAVASYRWIETPLRKGNWFGKRWKTLAVGGSILLVIASMITSIRKLPLLRSNLFLSKNKHLTATWWRDEDGKYIELCHIEKEFSVKLSKQCLEQGRAAGKRNIAFIIGDSHARNYVPAVRNALPSKDTRYLTMGHGCAFLPAQLIDKKIEEKVNCSKYVDHVSRFLINNARDGDIVFIGQSLVKNQSEHGARESPEYFSHIEKFARSLKISSISVVIFDGTFPPGSNPELCAKEVWRPFPNKDDCAKSIEQAKYSYHVFDTLAKQASRSNQNIYYAPLRIGLCKNDVCGQYTEQGTPIWHDRGHITEQSSGELADLLRQHLRQAGIYTVVNQ